MDETYLLFDSILKLGLKVSKPIYGVDKLTMWHILGQFMLKNTTELYNLFVDKKIFEGTYIDMRNLQKNEKLLEQFHIIQTHLDRENKQ